MERKREKEIETKKFPSKLTCPHRHCRNYNELKMILFFLPKKNNKKKVVELQNELEKMRSLAFLKRKILILFFHIKVRSRILNELTCTHLLTDSKERHKKKVSHILHEW